MSTTTLASWKQNIAIRLTTEVPTLSIETGVTLADNYLSQTGGWIPDDPGAPTDLGTPASGLSDDAIMVLLLAQINTSQYEFRATVNLPVSVILYRNLVPGLTASQVRDVSIDVLRAYIDRVCTELPITVNTAVLDYDSISTTVVGSVTAGQRVSFNAGITLDRIPILSVALRDIRAKFGLTSVWNFSSIYVSSDDSIEVTLKKYIDTTYSSLDETETRKVVASVTPYTGAILSGIFN